METGGPERAEANHVNHKCMLTDPESYCCHEWDLVTRQSQDLSALDDARASHLTGCLESGFIYLLVVKCNFT